MANGGSVEDRLTRIENFIWEIRDALIEDIILGGDAERATSDGVGRLFVRRVTNRLDPTEPYYQPFCSGCEWFGVKVFNRAVALAEQTEHDQQQHERSLR